MKRLAMKRIAIGAVVVGISTFALAWRGIQADSTRSASAGGTPSASSGSSNATTQVSMRNVNFYVIPNAALRIRHLRGEMRPLRGEAVVFDDKTSFVIRLAYAEIGLTGDDLSALMNSVVFAYPGAPLRRMRVKTSGAHLVQAGIMHKVVDLPFEITSEVAVTPQGLIRLHPVKTRILGIDGAGLMRAFGLSLEKILDLKKAKGVTVKGNDLFLDPTALLPPPAIEGRVTSIKVEGNELVQTFGTPAASTPLTPPDTSVQAYMYYKGGTLRFGKLLMSDAEMQIVALGKNPFFGFNLDRYKEQLVAGYSRTLPSFGLEVYMPSVETLRGGKTVAAHPPLL
jgi:hypothetical protein